MRTSEDLKSVNGLAQLEWQVLDQPDDPYARYVGLSIVRVAGTGTLFMVGNHFGSVKQGEVTRGALISRHVNALAGWLDVFIAEVGGALARLQHQVLARPWDSMRASSSPRHCDEDSLTLRTFLRPADGSALPVEIAWTILPHGQHLALALGVGTGPTPSGRLAAEAVAGGWAASRSATRRRW